MVMLEVSTSGPCKVSGSGDVASGELTMASTSSYTGPCALETAGNSMEILCRNARKYTIIQSLVSV